MFDCFVFPLQGLKHVLRLWYPECEHRHCVRHMWTNLRSKYINMLLKQLTWSTAKATEEGLFRKHMQAICTLNEDAFNWLHQRPFKEWSQAYFEITSYCAILTNNKVEGFNKDIMTVRSKSVLPCV